ncbi:MAG TPA: MG2 domain-containing protein [Bryobacteraceae bacterium]|nr:MG2 domain-containing protein [Bryobacteraceae bacterium]
MKVRIGFFCLVGCLLIACAATVMSLQGVRAASGDSVSATYSHGIFHVTIPYRAPHNGAGQLTVEILDPEDSVLGRSERRVEVEAGQGRWREDLRLTPAIALDDLVWHRLRYRFAYSDAKDDAIEGTSSISEVLLRPVVHILGQTAYLAGGDAAVRVIVTDSQNGVIGGPSTVRIELLAPARKPDSLFTGRLNRRGTAEAQFRFPAGMVGECQLRYVVDTPIGSTELSQTVRLEDKVPVLLTTEKPIYQPGQTIHVRALALDRANHAAAAGRKLTFEVEDSRGNKVFKKATRTDEFGIASAEFGLADEVNLGTYHLRALLGDAEGSNAAEIALNVERYVLPKFKVAVDLSGVDKKHGYRPGEHVTGTVRANYFFGKAVDGGEVTVKASAMDVSVFEAGSVQGKTDGDGAYRFDLKLPSYFAGRELSHGAARVLIEATVKDSAGHSETRGEPVTVSESPLIVTAVPEGGTLIPYLENQVFILTSYPDGTPAAASVRVHVPGSADVSATTDAGGVAVVRLKPGAGAETLRIDATDGEGNRASSSVQLEARDGGDQILLRTERAVYRAGDRIQLRVLSTKQRGTAYVDVVKEGQTVLTRDVDIVNGQAELALAATPELAGTVDISAYLFARNARPVGDHRLVFVQPADELKIEAKADAASYKPGGEARVQFRVTNSRGEGVQAALGLQVVDEAVFALAEKQPGFAKVFFYLEQEVMKPRYEIHSIGMAEAIEPASSAQGERRDRAARALFSATEIVSPNKFETEFGRAVPQAKYADYASRYRARFVVDVNRMSADLERAYRETGGDLTRAAGPAFRDPWDNRFRIERQAWFPRNTYVVRSAGPDKRFDTSDDLMLTLQVQSDEPSASSIGLTVEHGRGSNNGRAEITGSVFDQSGAVIPGATVTVRDRATGATRNARSDNSGQFTLSAMPAADYEVQVSAQGFLGSAGKFFVGARDRAVLSVTLRVGGATEQVSVVSASSQIVPAPPPPEAGFARRDGTHLGVAGGEMKQMAIVGRDAAGLMKMMPGVGAASPTNAPASDSPAPRVRSYFPEALYINPEIVTDGNGNASITIPLADSITTWRMAMMASTARGALGSGASSLKVFQDFFADIDLPVTLTQGDRVSIPVAVYNYSGASGSASLKLQEEDWFRLVDDSAGKTVSVDSGRVGGSQFTIEAQRIGKFKLTLSARMNDRADIVVREIEVIPNGREKTLVFNGRLENLVQHEVRFPDNAIPDASKIFVRLYPGPLSQVIEGMDSLLRMPFGCFEQTSSSTYPNVLALDYMKRTKKLTPEVHAKAEGYIANGYQRLLTFEVPGGGFSWFGSAPANKILTAYGLMEFYDMSQVHDVDPKLIARTQAWLAGQQQADGSWKPDSNFINEGATNRYNSDLLRITAYLAWSLENTGYRGPAVEKAKRFVEEHMGAKADAYTLAVVASLAADYGKDREFTNRAMELLLDARTEKGDEAWWTADETGVYATGASAAVETTGLAVQALLKWGEASGTAAKALRYIAAKKDASGTWGTTQATIMALRALLLSTGKGAADVRGTVEISLNGKPAATLALTPENNDLFHQFVFAQVDAKGANTVEIRFEGTGGLAYQVAGRYFVPWSETPAGEPLSIEVAYDRTRLAQDDIATATATVRNNLDKVANMVMVDLGIPPGFDLLGEDLQDLQEKSAGRKSGRLEKFSLTATQAILYFNAIAQGDTVTVTFRLRAKYPIRARTFQSRVYEYYDPEVSSVARPVQVEIGARRPSAAAR